MERDNTGSVMGWCITQFQVIAIKREMETDALWSTLFDKFSSLAARGSNLGSFYRCYVDGVSLYFVRVRLGGNGFSSFQQVLRCEPQVPLFCT